MQLLLLQSLCGLQSTHLVLHHLFIFLTCLCSLIFKVTFYDKSLSSLMHNNTLLQHMFSLIYKSVIGDISSIIQHRVVYPGFHNAHNMRAQISTYRCNSQSRKESLVLIAPQKVDIQNKIWVLNYFSGTQDHLYTCRIGVLWVHCI